MFSGIIETLGRVEAIHPENGNLHIEVSAPLDERPYPDQSIAHNGVCLTVTKVSEPQEGRQRWSVTAIPETLSKTNLKSLKAGAYINLERCLKAGARLDGHFVQGHVDAVGILEEIQEEGGSHILRIGFDREYAPLIVGKGSICLNGISLTVVKAGKKHFTVAIIPYTWAHTNLQHLKTGDELNLEFDILGKYILRAMQLGRL